MVVDFDNLPFLGLLSKCNVNNLLSNNDPDVNIPKQTNFVYYTPAEFQNNIEIANCSSTNYFSVLHTNIRSLNANFDSLFYMLTEMDHLFSLIGVAETKIKDSSVVLNNNEIPGYSFLSQPTLSNAGGAGIYISVKLKYSIKDDLSESTIGYEALWIEIKSDLKDDLVCGVIYRQPRSNLEEFMNYLNQTIDKLNRENKYCVLMDDFNLNLLISDLHQDTEEFLNTLGSYFCSPHIPQPT